MHDNTKTRKRARSHWQLQTEVWVENRKKNNERISCGVHISESINFSVQTKDLYLPFKLTTGHTHIQRRELLSESLF